MKIFWLSCIAVTLIALGIAETLNLPTKLIYNGSQSAPLGFYWIDKEPVVRGDYVLATVPERIKELVESRGYLPENVPLLKRVAAANDGIICRRDRGILLNGVTIAVARLKDEAGRELPNWQGCHILKSNELFLLQGHPNSFDGRYFGPVDRSMIIGKATKLRFTW